MHQRRKKRRGREIDFVSFVRYGIVAGTTNPVDYCVSVLDGPIATILGEAELSPLPGHNTGKYQCAYSSIKIMMSDIPSVLGI